MRGEARRLVGAMDAGGGWVSCSVNVRVETVGGVYKYRRKHIEKRLLFSFFSISFCIHFWKDGQKSRAFNFLSAVVASTAFCFLERTPGSLLNTVGVLIESAFDFRTLVCPAWFRSRCKVFMY